MSGPFYGKIDCWSNTGNFYTNGQEMFKGLYDFFVYLETQSVVSIITRYDGESATGTDYHDGVNPFRTMAFFVVQYNTASSTPANPSYAGPRTQPFYLLFQYWRADQGGQLTAGTNGLPARWFGLNGGVLGSTSTGIGMQMAVGIGGDFNPWNGTISAGSAAKGNPVWKNPAGGGTGRLVFPRSNTANVFGTSTTGTNPAHTTSQENMASLFYRNADTTGCRYHFLSDYDAFACFHDYPNGINNNLHAFAYNGIFTPRAGLTHTHPYVQIEGNAGLGMGTGTQYGDYAGTTQYQNGGIAYLTYGNEVRTLILSRLDEVLNSTSQPNRFFSTRTYDEMPILVGPYDYFGGLAGTLPWPREVANVPNLHLSNDQKKIALGSSNTVSTIKCFAPWHNTVVPAQNLTRGGAFTGVFP